jgi:hypothetical protein
LILRGAWLKEQLVGAKPCLFLWAKAPGRPSGEAAPPKLLRRALTGLNRDLAFMGLLMDAVVFLPAGAVQALQPYKIAGLYFPPEETAALLAMLRGAWAAQSALAPAEDFLYWQSVYESLLQPNGCGKDSSLSRQAEAMPDAACNVVQYRGKLPCYVGPEKQERLTSFIGAMRSAIINRAFDNPASTQVFRTCLRLEEPEAQTDPWRLSFWLQPEDDPSLLISAADIREVSAELAGCHCFQLPGLQERLRDWLRRDLTRAAHGCRPIATVLEEQHPTACRLSNQEARRFLAEQAEQLRAAGLGVSIPNWWCNNPAGPGIRLTVEEVACGPGFLGVAALAGYKMEASLGGQVVSRNELERIAALKMPLVLLAGRWCEFDPAKAKAALALLDRHADRTMPLGKLLAAAASGDVELLDRELPGLEEPVSLPVLEFAASESLCAKIPALQLLTVSQAPAPPGFRGALRPYQSRGVAWLTLLAGLGLGGCLADDMGLGKTVQVIAYLLGKRRQNPQAPPALIVCPLSVVDNWRREFARFAPGLRVMLHHGADRLSRKRFVETAVEQDAVLTTYALVHRDNADFQSLAWGDVILDEAQNIKNPLISQTAAVMKLSAPCRVALTGTPVENRLRELWSIMQFLNPGFLLPLPEFELTFSQPIERQQDLSRQQELQQLIQPFLLRRLKTDKSIAPDLPDKQETKLYCPLTREQSTLYAATLEVMLDRIAKAEPFQRKALIAATLTKLKQICNHPAHFLKDGSALAHRSGKLIRLVEMLTELKAEGRRALIFTQYAQMGHLMEQYLGKLFAEPVSFLHGSLAKPLRDKMVNDFQQSDQAPSFFILSLKAGGVGLNLTRADTVFHFDRWWNPAVEDQATDRAFRIGQTRNVQVYKMIATATLEEKIDDMIESKKQLAGSIIGSGEAWLSELSTADLHSILRLRRPVSH